MRRRSLGGHLTLLAAFAVAAGHIEAVALVSIVRLADVPPGATTPSPADLHHIPGSAIGTEQTRLAASLIALLIVAGLSGRNVVEKVGSFLYLLGARQITYYVSLLAMIGRPTKAAAPDCLIWLVCAESLPVWIPLSAAVGVAALGAAIQVLVDRYNR